MKIKLPKLSKKKKDTSKTASDNESSGSRDLVFVEPMYVKRPRRFKIEIDFNKMIELPPLVDENEWLATHTVGLFHNTNNLLNVITEICTSDSCLSMNGPNDCVFNWQDDRGKNMRVSAPQYYDFAMTWCQQRLTNQSIFPTKFGDDFPHDYRFYIERIMHVLWAVVCHIYHAHWLQIKGRGHFRKK